MYSVSRHSFIVSLSFGLSAYLSAEALALGTQVAEALPAQAAPSTAPTESPIRPPTDQQALSDKPIPSAQLRLLDMAMEAASRMPIAPHIKSRSVAQESVISACLQLDQPGRALRYLEHIANWRKGCAYGDLAVYCAKQQDEAHASEFLGRAAYMAEGIKQEIVLDEKYAQQAGAGSATTDANAPRQALKYETAQDWQVDRIQAKVAAAKLWLGQKDQALQSEFELDDAEVGKASIVRSMRVTPETFDQTLKELDELVALGNFDSMRNGFVGYGELIKRFYDDLEKREVLQQRLREKSAKMPREIRVNLTLDLAEFAGSHGDVKSALEYIQETRQQVTNFGGSPDLYTPLMSRVAREQFRAGEANLAHQLADEVLAYFDLNKEKLQNFERAQALCPLAECYAQMGDSEAALTVYRWAVELGSENPNGRPRAEDLVRICLSMAVNGIEPDGPLWERLAAIQAGLVDPW